MSSSPEAQAIRQILNSFRDRGLKDEAGAALSIMRTIFADTAALDSPVLLEPAIPEDFLLVNKTSAVEVHDALGQAAASLRLLAHEAQGINNPPLLQISDIDTFSRTRTVAATQVADFAMPLDLAEDIVEKIIAKVIGEPNLVKDWGGEFDDLYTGQVTLNGRNVRTSFLLKGNGLRVALKPRYLGKNGDQITRMMAQPAELYVVQHVNRVDPSVTKQLRDAILARRAEGNTTAVGTVWDGVDTARLGVAYGFLDSADGTLIPGTLGSGS
jgi:hypothetical protein